MSVAPRARLLAVFALALGARLGFLLLADQPLLYTHQYTYFTNALRLAEDPSPLRTILTSDEWRTWDGHWTIAPLYFVTAAASFKVFGPHLFPLQLLQCLLDAGVALMVAALGLRVSPRFGIAAGVAYALFWPAIELVGWTMTENAHTALFTLGLLLLVREHEAPSAKRQLVAGLAFGFSALARSVSSAYLGLAVLWRAWPAPLRNWRPAALVLVGGLAAILPWTARNFLIVGEHVLIEDAAFENIWWANNLVDRNEYLKQEKIVHAQPTSELKRAAALRFALQGLRDHKDRVPEKISSAFWHFLRPEGLQNLFRVERSLEPWRHTVTLLCDDLPMLLAIPPFLVFLLAAPRGPTRDLILLWTAYYVAMVVIVFHNEVRYRSALMPFVFVGAAGGLAILGNRASRSWRAWLGLGIGLFLVARVTLPFLPAASRALVAAWTERPLAAAVERSDFVEADRLASAAAQADLRSARPWIRYGRRLAARDETERALAAYRRAGEVASIANWSPRIALPRLLALAGSEKDAMLALRQLDRLSWNTDPWLVLEIAWRELPAPRADEVLLARGDYGAVRGFFHPRGTDPGFAAPRLEWNKYERLGDVLPPPGGHRWSRGRSWIRLRPATSAPAYDVTLEMGAPFPSTLIAPRVEVRVNDGPATTWTLTTEVKPYVVRAAIRPGDAIVVRIDAPTWCRSGEPAEQGVRVDRLSVTPAR